MKCGRLAPTDLPETGIEADIIYVAPIELKFAKLELSNATHRRQILLHAMAFTAILRDEYQTDHVSFARLPYAVFVLVPPNVVDQLLKFIRFVSADGIGERGTSAACRRLDLQNRPRSD